MSDINQIGKELRKTIIFAAFVFLAIKFIGAIIHILLIFAVSIIFVLVLNPIVSFFEKKKIPRAISASVLALTTIALVVLFFVVAIPPAVNQLADLWEHRDDFITQVNELRVKISYKYPEIAQFIPADFKLTGETWGKVSGPLLGGISKATMGAAGAILSSFLVFIITIYVLANPKPLIDGVLSAFDEKTKQRAIIASQKLYSAIKAWVGATVIGMIFIFLLVWIGLSIIGIKQAFLFALIAGFMEAVPVIGPVISAIPPIIMALTQEPIMAIWVVVLFIGINQVEGNLLIPLIMSKQLSIHPVSVIFAVLVLGGVFGIVGIFLAAPIAVAAGIIYNDFYLKSNNFSTNEEEEKEHT
ncbi:MAG: AI-2E family transporter [Armatimonadota bacterium]